MNDIKIFDNVLPKGYADQIELDISRTGFPWFYIDDVTNKNYGNNAGLVHPAYDFNEEPSQWHPFIRPLIYTVEELNQVPITQLLRIRVGLLTKNNGDSSIYNTPHIDFTVPHYTACYYVNDSDGDTVIFDQKLSDLGSAEHNEQNIKKYVEQAKFTVAKRCSPNKNSLCIFNGERFHSSSMPTTHNKRFVISINYL
jgi:hypothetical protein